MNTCKTCKHWEMPEPQWSFELQGCGRCNAIPLYVGVSRLDGSGLRVLKDEYKTTLAFAEDADDYMACLRTLPDFGCVMHEPPDRQGEES